MIEINLLPENMRRPEGMPIPRLLITIMGVALLTGACFYAAYYKLRVVETWQQKLDAVSEKATDLKEKAERLDELNEMIAEVASHVKLVKELYVKRTIISKLLWDIKQIVNFNPMYGQKNDNRMYLWLSQVALLGGKGRGGMKLSLSGAASAPDSESGSKMLRDLQYTFRNSTIDDLISKEEEARLRENLAKWQEWLAKQKEATESDVDRPKQMIEIERRLKRLEEIKNSAETMIAQRSFYDLFIKNSDSFSMSWSEKKPNARGGAAEGEDQLLPLSRYNFDLTLTFKPTPNPPAESSRKGKKKK